MKEKTKLPEPQNFGSPNPPSFGQKLIVNAAISLICFLLANILGEQSDYETRSWYYASAILISYFIFGGVWIFDSRYDWPLINLGFITNLISGMLFVIFLLSFTGIFDGPYHNFCRWPILVITAGIIFFRLIILFIVGMLEALFAGQERYEPYQH